MRFAVLGYGKIAREVMIPAIQKSGHRISVIGSASGNAPDGFEGEVVHDYVEAFRRENVDAVYIALPNHLHHELSAGALESNRPVLCEKPLGLSSHQVADLAQKSKDNQTLLREAFMVAHHPQWEWLRSQVCGEEQIDISVQFHYDNRDPLNIRNRPETGGGALLDIGCYALWIANWLGAKNISDVHGYADYSNGVDAQSFGSIWFDENIRLHFDVSMRRARFQQVVVQSQRKCWVIPRPFNPLLETVVWTMGASGITDEQHFVANQYERMVDAFCRDIEGGSNTDLSSSLRIATWSELIGEQLEKR